MTATRTKAVGGWRARDIGRALDAASFALLVVALAGAPLATGATTDWSLGLLRLLVISATALWLVASLIEGRIALPRRGVGLALTGYLVVVATSILASGSRYTSLQAAGDIGVYVAALLLASAHVRGPRWKTLLVSLTAAAWILALYGLLELAGLTWTPHQSTVRLSSLYFNSNHYSGYLAIITPLVFAAGFAVRNKWLRLQYAALAVALAFSLVFTFSWGLLATGGAMMALVFHRVHQAMKPMRLLLTVGLSIVGVALAVTGMLLFTPQLGQRPMAERVGSFYGVWVRTSLETRVGIAESSLRMIRDHPLLGVGPGNFIFVYPRYRPAQVRTLADSIQHSFVNYAHNDFTQIACESGLLGLASFLAVLWQTLGYRQGSLPPALASGVTCGLLALIFHGLSDGNFTVIPANALLGWAFLGLLSSGKGPT